MAVASSPAGTGAGSGGLSPTLEETRELARRYNLIPVRETFIDDCETPVSAFLKLREEGPAFLLESAEQGRVGRYSFIGFRPRKVLRWSLGDPGDPYALAAEELARFDTAPIEDLPPFAGGAVGMFAYDLVRTAEPLGEPNPDPLKLPDLALMLTDVLVAFDHFKRTITVIANVYAANTTTWRPRTRERERRSRRSAGGSPAPSRARPSRRRATVRVPSSCRT